MNGNRKHFFLSNDSVFGTIVMLSVLIGCCASVVQCRNAEVDDTKSAAQVPQTVIRNGYAIQVFPTAQQQLRHALGWFPDLHEKKASLEVVIDAFPGDRNVRAEAELELAYLTLGRDYRYASPKQCRAAIGKYQKILTDFSDLSVICAEANWYIGWILSDLLDEPGKASAYFQIVVEKYPDTTLNLKSAVPWVSLVLPQVEERPQAVYERPKYYWQSIALLELVRISEKEADKWSAFEKLYADHRSSRATGFAIRELLSGPPSLQRKTAAYAQQHLKATLFSAPMAKEIHELLKTADLLDHQSYIEQNLGDE